MRPIFKLDLTPHVKAVAFILSICAVALLLCWALGLVEFTYLNVVPNEPLLHPRKVQIIDGTNMFLESGEIIRFWPPRSSARSDDEVYLDISNQVRRSDFQIDIETNETGILDIFVRHPRKFRDTVPPFVIPVIRKNVGRDWREREACGAYVHLDTKPNDATNVSQENHLEPNRTPSVAAPAARK